MWMRYLANHTLPLRLIGAETVDNGLECSVEPLGLN